MQFVLSLDCCGGSLCSYCLSHHKDHRVVQIRRSSYHNVVRVNEIQRYWTLPCVQTYIINSAKIVFLTNDHSLDPVRVSPTIVRFVAEALLMRFRFCSLGCKLGGMKRGDRELSFTQRMKHGRDPYEPDEPLTPQKGHSDMSCSSTSGDDTTNNMSPGTPPISNHRNSNRRKGIPRRAPF
ncbi:hypothetical protein E3N88_40236 [Mikania micrantha]|uniref:Uncharacterized protein n=1 Tax=Mikania micrantha TaxID=192012 RepID=A0A5N6LM51_9ASTR|nr:hypothetical protein E3N88_40236 [Mikania micrantha]